MYALAHLDPEWREKNVRAIMFDSCPPKSDVYAFGGWLSWLVQAKTGVPARMSKPVLSQLFHPVRPYFGIDATWTALNDHMMFGDTAHGQRVRSLPFLRGGSPAECLGLAEAAARRAHTEAPGRGAEVSSMAGGCVVPRSTHCLFARGHNDPVLEPQYIDAYYAFLKARTTASVEWHLFEKAQHAMAVVEAPAQYKGQLVTQLLRRVPEWRV